MVDNGYINELYIVHTNLFQVKIFDVTISISLKWGLITLSCTCISATAYLSITATVSSFFL